MATLRFNHSKTMYSLQPVIDFGINRTGVGILNTLYLFIPLCHRIGFMIYLYASDLVSRIIKGHVELHPIHDGGHLWIGLYIYQTIADNKLLCPLILFLLMK